MCLNVLYQTGNFRIMLPEERKHMKSSGSTVNFGHFWLKNVEAWLKAIQE